MTSALSTFATHAGRVGAGAGTGAQTIQIRPAVLAKGLQGLAERIECGDMQGCQRLAQQFLGGDAGVEAATGNLEAGQCRSARRQGKAPDAGEAVAGSPGSGAALARRRFLFLAVVIQAAMVRRLNAA